MPRAATACLLLLILLLHVVLLASSMRIKSPTIDEPHHLTIGLMTLASGDFRMCRDDPPLQNLINGAPVLLFYQPSLPFSNENWHSAQSYGALAHEFIQTNSEYFLDYVWTARWTSVGISLATCCVVFLWTRELFGDAAGLFSIALAAFEPTLIAHGRLVTTDILATFFFVGVCFFLWRTVKKPSVIHWIIVAFLLGAALATKHSLILLLPFAFLAVAWIHFCATNKGQSLWRRTVGTLGHFVLLLLAAGLVLWTIYGFEIGDSVKEPRPPILDPIWSTLYETAQTTFGLFGLDSPLGDPNDPEEPVFAAMRSSLPLFSYWESFFTQAAHARRGHWATFLGEVGTRGWWLYYPVLFVTKTTIPFLLMTALGVFFLLRDSRYSRVDRLFVLGPPIFFFLFLVFTNRAAIGIRHLMPILPVYCVAAGAWFEKVRQRWSKNRAVIGILVFLLCWHFAETLWAYPHYIPYYNEAVGGPANGIHISTDSNLDWGQDLPLLNKEIQENNIDDFYFIYFGSPDLIPIYGLDAVIPYPDDIGRPGWWAISATCLSGIGSRYTADDLAVFREMEPEAVVGYSIYLFRISAE